MQPSNPTSFTVEPEIRESMLRMLDDARYGGEPELDELDEMLRNVAGKVRAGEPIDLVAFSTSSEAWRVGSQLVREASYVFERVGPETDHEQDWRYLSDLAALAADIDVAFTA